MDTTADTWTTDDELAFLERIAKTAPSALHAYAANFSRRKNWGANPEIVRNWLENHGLKVG